MSEQKQRRAVEAIESAEESAPESVLAGCRIAIREKFPALLEGLFSKLDAALYDLADKSESNTAYTEYLDAMRVFRRERTRIEDRFIRGLESAGEYLKGPSGNPSHYPASAHRSDESKLPEHEELEESLAVGNLISKAENRFGRELADLRRQLADFLGRESIDSLSDPLGPHAICSAFKTALAPVEGVSLSLKLVVYKLFDKQVMDQLGDFYQSCAACLASSMVASRSPERQWHQFRGAVTPKSDSDAPLAADDCAPVAVRGPAPASQGQPFRGPVFEELQGLLVRRRADRASGGTVVETSELMAALSRLQGYHGLDGATLGGPRALWSALTEELRLHPDADGGRDLTPADEDTLDLVVLLFESILQRNDLPDSLKALIARLQIPIAKVALSDKTFFDDPRHPARRLVNHLAQSALGWVDDGDRSPDGDYRRIERAVTCILEELDRDFAVFAELDADLCTEIARGREDARASEAKAIQEMEGKERHRNALEKVRGVIAKRIRASAPVPEVISALLYEGWQQVLLATYLRGGVEGAEWRNALDTVDRLLWSVQPKVEYGERRELLRRIPELLRTLRGSLAGVSNDQRHFAQWFRELQVLHIAALRGSGPGKVETGSSPGTSRADTEPATESSIPLGAGDSEAPPIAFSQRLPVGTWMEIRRSDGGVIRAKIAWRSRDGRLNMLVGRSGRKVLELSDGELASLLEQGRASILPDAEEPLVDHAMEILMQSLKRG